MRYYLLILVFVYLALNTFGLITPMAYEQAIGICEKHQGLKHIAATFLSDDKVACNDGYHHYLELDLYPYHTSTDK